MEQKDRGGRGGEWFGRSEERREGKGRAVGRKRSRGDKRQGRERGRRRGGGREEGERKGGGAGMRIGGGKRRQVEARIRREEVEGRGK